MKVKSLVDMLVGYNPDAHVVIYDGDVGTHLEITNTTVSPNEVYSTVADLEQSIEAVGEVVILGLD